jgi:hypothetical protein
MKDTSQEGRHVEEGIHEGSMLRGGHYTQLYNTYVRHRSSAYVPGSGFVPVMLPIPESEGGHEVHVG